MNSCYIPSSDSKLTDYTLFVGRVNPKTNEGTLEEYFSRFGCIRKVTVVRI